MKLRVKRRFDRIIALAGEAVYGVVLSSAVVAEFSSQVLIEAVSVSDRDDHFRILFMQELRPYDATRLPRDFAL